MLEELLRYAKSHALETEPGFAPKQVRWAIVCSRSGQFLDVMELGETDSKRNRGLRFAKCPNLTQPEMVQGGQTRSQFLVDTAEVVALLSRGEPSEKARAKHAYFIGLLREASVAMPELKLFVRALCKEDTLAAVRHQLEERGARLTDKATLAVGGRRPPYVVESHAWHEWWRVFRRGLSPQEQPAVGRSKKRSPPARMRCLLTGELIEPCATHPKIGLTDVGGQSTGSVLISFDKPAFASYGLEQSANAAVSEQSAYAYCGALDQLIEETGKRLAGAKVVHWFKEHIDPENDPLEFLAGGDEETEELNAQQRARKLLEAVRSGERADLMDNHYYAITLSGAAGRVMVRDWMEGQFEELLRNVNAWFDDLRVTSYTGRRSAPCPRIERLITCLLPELKPRQKYSHWIRQVGMERIRLWRSAVRGDRIPHQVLAKAVILNAKYHQKGELQKALERGEPEASTLSVLYARMALMKAFHIRERKTPMSHSLNKGHPEVAYHCGRLMAMMAGVQYAALGDVGAGLVQRFYAAASSTPSLVLGRLTRLSQFHLNKLNPPLARWHEGRIASVWARIEDRPPKTLDLEGQSLFALGYYHQVAADRTKSPDNSRTSEEKTDE